jgi:hypothetical protein
LTDLVRFSGSEKRALASASCASIIFYYHGEKLFKGIGRRILDVSVCVGPWTRCGPGRSFASGVSRAVWKYFLTGDSVKLANDVLRPVEDCSRRLTVPARRQSFPRVPNTLASFAGVSRSRETTCARTLFPALPWLYMMDTGGDDRHTSS